MFPVSGSIKAVRPAIIDVSPNTNNGNIFEKEPPIKSPC